MSKPRFCVDCKWYKAVEQYAPSLEGPVSIEVGHTCTYGEVVTHDLVTGEQGSYFEHPDCIEARALNGRCGKDGKHWEAKDAV